MWLAGAGANSGCSSRSWDFETWDPFDLQVQPAQRFNALWQTGLPIYIQYVHICTHTYDIYTYIYTLSHIYTHAYIYIHTYAHTHTYTHIYMHTYIHIHIYSHVHICMPLVHIYMCV
uniref:Uncharacterized protein n=1 Tax=Anolis carolinensis TaxID=28377 RepID=A0A803SPK3_ANOCA